MLQCRTAQYSASVLQYKTSTVDNSIVQYSTVDNSTVKYSTVQYSTIGYNTGQYRTVQN